MIDEKQLWDKLAKKNAMYYINSDFGKDIDRDTFRHTGLNDFCKYIDYDDVLHGGDFGKPKSEWVFLEIGCGNGRMTEFMEDKKVIAIDISGEMIRQARERCKHKKNVQFFETDGMTIPLDNNSVDVAFSYLVFQHMKTLEMVERNFCEVYRVLKPGGMFKVRVRTDKINNMDKWWAGVSCDETYPLSIGFELIKKQLVKDCGLWLWLKKPQ